MRLIECVPNISEGKDKNKIQKILAALCAVQGVELLGCEMGKSANRTVITYVVREENAINAALALVKKSAELIDMRKHFGVHPRIGCVDVLPFIPYKKISLEDCAEIAKHTAQNIGKTLGIPVYLYGTAAETERRELSFLRKGGYESLPSKMQILPPDFGPKIYTENVAKSGVLCVGARNFLLAYNINLNTKDLALAKALAKDLRAQLQGIKTLGWYIEEYGFCQVSVNIEDYKKAPLYLVYETCKSLANKFNISVTGSEIIGLLPKDALLDSAKFYLNKQNKIMLGMPHEEVFDLVIKNLNLSQISPFIPEEKVLELKIKNSKN